MALTGPMLKSIAGAVPGGDQGRQVASWDTLAKDCNDAGKLLGFTTVEGYSSFIANCCQESAYFRTTEEYAKNGRYAPYIGRTFIQVTWKTNYEAFGKYAVKHHLEGLTDPNKFVKNPKSLAEVRWAWWGPCWYFSKTWGGETLVQIADRTKSNLAVARAINMGSPTSSHTPGGIKTRDALFKKACSYGERIMPERTTQFDGIMGMTHIAKYSYPG